MSARTDIKKILIIGSGPIMIGQACEFDYSGNQAVRALKEEGYQVVLVNPNPATVMTTPGIADAIYCDPLEVPFVEAIIREERPDALLATMGGQTALNLTLALDEAGVLERYGVETIGARTASIRMAEDRGLFKAAMERIGLESARSALVSSVTDAEGFLDEVGLPAIIRPSYTLGGRGGAIAHTREEFRNFVDWALTESPVHTALIEESLLGWREFELEVMRDQADNAVIVCSIENIDPMGVHTGDSITIAPIQTLSDREYQRMRTAAIEILREIGVDCGGSNVQFALDPSGERMIVIEMNPRVSRSSALASKATGFPIARCSAKLAVGYTLDEITNEITGKTVSCFEPSLDYCAIKVPRFELEKFPQGYVELGTQMKSVGEALSLGRSFAEALNKAIRAAEFGFSGLESLPELPQAEIDRMIDTLHPRRIFALYTELCRRGMSAIDELATRSGYHPWFLYEMAALAELEGRITASPTASLAPALLLEAKRNGIADKRIAALTGSSEATVRASRNAAGLHAAYHFVDTCSGEFDAATPYFYGTYGEIDEGAPVGAEGVVILASGPNRIGQGLEFDTCCTLCSLAYRTHGVTTVIINSNPETVSTDFNVSDRLYLEPLTSEDVLEVLHKEGIKRVVVQLGGQTPLNMARELEAAGAEVVGTPTAGIERAENRELFYRVLQDLSLKLPINRMASTADGVEKAAEEIGYPVLLRPSYVLGGRSMVIAFNRDELHEFLEKRVVVSPEAPVLVDQFLEDAYEYDID
ncbi:MAG: carbamoyl-phosphate synthase large subunit, partial [Spirochaetaceae bacterium]